MTTLIDKAAVKAASLFSSACRHALNLTRRFGLSFAFVAGWAIVILVAAELFQRTIEPDPIAYFMFPPNTSRTIQLQPEVIGGVHPTAQFNVNRYGLRGDPPNTSDKARILVIGGSTVESLVQNDNDTWSAVLQKLINEMQGNRDTWVGNAGRAGITSFENVIQLRHLPDMLPKIDTVVVLVGANDVAYGYSRSEDSKYAEATEQDRYDRTFFSIVRPGATFPKNLALYRLYLSVSRLAMFAQRGVLQGAAGGDSASFARWLVASRQERMAAERPLRDRLPDLEPYLAVYRRNLNQMVDLSAQRQIKLVFVTQPLMYRAGQSAEDEATYGSFGKAIGYTTSGTSAFYASGAIDAMMRMYNRETEAVCVERAVVCIDAASQIPPTRDNYYDGIHMTDAGNAALARVVFEGLKAASLVTKAGAGRP